MAELERFSSLNDLFEGSIVTCLKDVTDKPSCGSGSDVPEERAFFLEEKFATFDCDGDFGDNGCVFSLVSQIPWTDHYAWAIFGYYNLSIDNVECLRQRESRITFVKQKLSIKLIDNVDYGYFQMICIPERVYYDSCGFNKFDIITFMVYVNRKIGKKYISPLVITLNPKLDTTYVPLIPNQHLQLITANDVGIDFFDCGLTHVVNSDKSFNLGRNNIQEKLKASTYVCNQLSEGIAFTAGDFAVVLPKLTNEDRGIFATILKPIGDAIIHAECIDGIHLICPDEQQWSWDDSCISVEATEDGIDILLLKPLNNVCLQLYNGIWQIFESYNVAVGAI